MTHASGTHSLGPTDTDVKTSRGPQKPGARRLASLLFVISALLVTWPAWAGDRLAVLEVQGEIAQNTLLLLTDQVRAGARDALDGQSGAIVMTRENTLTLLTDMGIDPAVCTALANCEVDAGRQIGATLVISGQLVSVEGTLLLTLKLYDTASAAMLASELVQSETQLGLIAAAEEAGHWIVTIGLERVADETTGPARGETAGHETERRVESAAPDAPPPAEVHPPNETDPYERLDLDSNGHASSRAAGAFSMRGGYTKFQALDFVTVGIEYTRHPGRALGLDWGLTRLSVERVVEARFVDEGGEQTQWNRVYAMHLGLMYKPEKERFRPYVASDATLTAYALDPLQFAPGLRLRGGLDVMAHPVFGLNLELGSGFWYGSAFNEVQNGMDDLGVVLSAQAGVVVHPRQR